MGSVFTVAASLIRGVFHCVTQRARRHSAVATTRARCKSSRFRVDFRCSRRILAPMAPSSSEPGAAPPRICSFTSWGVAPASKLNAAPLARNTYGRSVLTTRPRRVFPHPAQPPRGRTSPSHPRVSCRQRSVPFFPAHRARSSCEIQRPSGAFD